MDIVDTMLRSAIAARKRESLEKAVMALLDAANTLCIYEERALALQLIEYAATISAAAEAGAAPPSGRVHPSRLSAR